MQLTTLTIADGVRIVVPDLADSMTTYVLKEQRDWFEDEIKFLRRAIQPGQRAIDIGANHGVYALSLAVRVGPSGRVWAFEPASLPADCLQASIRANGLENLVFERCALSNCTGFAELTLDKRSSELGSISRSGDVTMVRETVSQTTLDACQAMFSGGEIDFVKIDVEGAEKQVIEGGHRFFDERSPLVMLELMDGQQQRDYSAVDRLCRQGYGLYRLVPGLGLLVSVGRHDALDDHLINIFCCKPDRADYLAALGLLLRPDTVNDTPDEREGMIASWRETVGRMPYGLALTAQWSTVSGVACCAVDRPLALYAQSQSDVLSPLQRYRALKASYDVFQRMGTASTTAAGLSSLARAARDFGARTVAVKALEQLVSEIQREFSVDLSEPFLAPEARFDQIVPGEEIEGWFLAAVLEAYERLVSFSSYFNGDDCLRRLEIIRHLGMGSEEMHRRWQLKTGAGASIQ